MKKIIGYPILILLILMLGFYISNYFATKRVKDWLADNSSISYEKLNINIFSGNLKLDDFHFKDKRQKIKVVDLNLSVDIFTYLTNDKINIKSIDAENVDLNLTQTTENENDRSVDFDTINIDKIHFKNVKLSLKEKSEAFLKISDLNFKAKNISWPFADDYQWIKNSSIKVDAGALRYDLDDLHFLKSDNVTFDKNTLSFTNFAIQPTYSKSDYIDHIKTEKDLINLKTSSLAIADLDLTKQKDEKLRLHISEVQISDSDLNIYRDKTIADDHSIKPLYSQALREIGFQLQVDMLSLSSLDLTYQELMQKNEKPANLTFNSIKGQITNLHNQMETKNPEIKAGFQGKFSPNSKIDLRLSFVPDHERFYVSTYLNKIKDQSVNSFFEPAMNLKMDGQIYEIKTSISANNTKMSGDFNMAYDNLKIDVLKKDGSKNGFLSTVGNIFVKNNDVKETVKINNLKRDKTKSFWNYIWSFHREGLKKVML